MLVVFKLQFFAINKSNTMKSIRIVVFALAFFLMQIGNAQNPIINTQFTADPTARVFNGKLYLYPSHDIPCGKGQGYIGFCMADYHVFSSENLTDWEDHGVVLTQNDLAWGNSSTYSMWAPDCVYKNSKYYFYFPAIAKDTIADGKNRRIGVATSDFPYGPFVPEKNYIPEIKGIDPNVFIDKDNQAYIYWASNKQIYGSKLKDNLLELETEPQIIETATEKFKEGPFVFERNGIYYLTYPFVNAKTEQLVYAMGKHPMGPFEYKGVIMKESPNRCWTNHQSIVNFKNQWYLFYHHNDYSPKFDKNRSVKIDSLFFNKDGTIQEVVPTWRGVGITKAVNKIQIDRYSMKSDEGVAVEYLDELEYFKGWKLLFNKPESWVSYNNVDFGKSKLKKLTINALATNGGSFELRLNSINGKLFARGKLDKSTIWNSFTYNLKNFESGVHHLYFIAKGSETIEVDYIRFE
jgi:beta-xylosidase